MSLKRNAELHSGEAPFEGVVAASWEGRYWHTAEIILEASDSSIESWIGADKAKAPKELLAEYTHATEQAAKVRDGSRSIRPSSEERPRGGARKSSCDGHLEYAAQFQAAGR
jgi:hypothetical protein